jgi:hypothetical protein
MPMNRTFLIMTPALNSLGFFSMSKQAPYSELITYSVRINFRLHLGQNMTAMFFSSMTASTGKTS